MAVKVEGVSTRPFKAYTDAELDHWVKLKNTKDDDGHKLTWEQVSKITRVPAGSMASIISQRKTGVRTDALERYTERATLLEYLAYKGLRTNDIAKGAGLTRSGACDHLNRIGITPDVRKKYRRVAGFRRETLELTRERRSSPQQF